MVRIFRGGRLADLEPELQSGVARGRPITVHHADLDAMSPAWVLDGTRPCSHAEIAPA